MDNLKSELINNMRKREYGNFPTIEEIKRDYNELMKIIKDIRTIEQAKQLDGELTIEINGMSIEEFLQPDNNGYVCTNKDVEWIRYEVYGCLSYVYDRFDGRPMFDVWSNYCDDEFIRDITIDKLTKEFYEKRKGFGNDTDVLRRKLCKNYLNG